MLLHLVTDHIRIGGLDDWMRGFAERLAAQSDGEVRTVQDAGEADAIVFLSSGVKRGGLVNRNHLAAHPLGRRFPQKCFLWCTDDQPLSYLPGLYTSLPRRYFHARLHRSYSYFELPTERTPVPMAPGGRDIFYNFIGGPTHPVRQRITALQHGSDTFVQRTVNLNHGNKGSQDMLETFVATLARSRFTLCPRGVGASSYRLFESMRCGSIPVVISDGLVLPEGPDWEGCSVRVAEKDLARLRAILEAVTDHEERSARAREAFEKFFAPDRHLRNVARLIGGLQQAGLAGRPANTLRFAAAQVEGTARRVAGKIVRK